MAISAQGGSFTVAQSLESLRVAGGSVYDLDFTNVGQQIQLAFDAHNMIVKELLSKFATVTTLRNDVVPAVKYYNFEEVDELGSAGMMSQGTYGDLGYPLRKYNGILGWTATSLKVMKPIEMVNQVVSLLTADIRNIHLLLRNALFNSTNYNYTDRFVDSAVLKVKRLQNNDTTTAVPINPVTGENIATSHTHYKGYASFLVATFDDCIASLVEHFGENGKVEIYINTADVAAAQAFTGFQVILPVNYVPNTAATHIDPAWSLNTSNLYDRLVGFYQGCEVWAKWWVPASYVVGIISGEGIPTPLKARIRGTGENTVGGESRSIIGGSSTESGSGDLVLLYDNPDYPILAKEWQREIGFGAYGRVSAWVAYTANATYAVPTITY